MKKILPLLLLTPTLTNAECTPTPDCASIGYTETSCETISLKCPFDQSKLYCFPCDSSYQYSCSEPNEYGDGESCNDKYKSCCNTDCIVGAIYYSDKTCSSCVDNTKTPIGIVVKDNELIMSKRKSNYITWSSTHIDTPLSNYSNNTSVITDFNGKSNTIIIVNSHSSNTSENNASIYCNTYSTNGTNIGDWYLPAAGELYSYVYGNYKTIQSTYSTKLKWPDFNDYYWSSSEASNTNAYRINSYYDGINNIEKKGTSSVTCFLALN